MRNFVTRMFLCGGLAAFLSAMSASAIADESKDSKKIDNAPETYVAPMGIEFARGIANVATGWGEIPRQIILAGKDDGIALALPYGLPSGIFMTVARTFYGAVETVFFFIPFEDDYSSAMKPAYVWQKRPVAAPEEKKEEAKK